VIDAHALCITAAPARLHTYGVPVSHKARRMRTQSDKREPFADAKAFHFAAISLKIHLIVGV
jgi:hypothetical protein